MLFPQDDIFSLVQMMMMMTMMMRTMMMTMMMMMIGILVVWMLVVWMMMIYFVWDLMIYDVVLLQFCLLLFLLKLPFPFSLTKLPPSRKKLEFSAVCARFKKLPEFLERESGKNGHPYSRTDKRKRK